METSTRLAVGFNLAVVVGVGFWLFGQEPLPEQVLNPKSDPITTTALSPSKLKVEEARSRALKIEPANASPKAGLTVPGNDTELAATGVKTLILNGSSVRMRAGPSTASEHLATYGSGENFQKLDQRGDWIQVRNLSDGAEGWIFQRYLKPQS